MCHFCDMCSVTLDYVTIERRCEEQTSNYGLYVTDDSTTKFKEWREKMASEANSNMTKIDTAFRRKLSVVGQSRSRLLASGWTGEAVPYLQTITVEGLTADANGSFDCKRCNQ